MSSVRIFVYDYVVGEGLCALPFTFMNYRYIGVKLMKIISDIRSFRSVIANIDGNPLPESFGSKQLNIVIHRIVMKLREQKFSLGEYDHLYLNFTTQLNEGVCLPAKRSIDTYHKWYRFYDIGVSKEMYYKLNSESSIDYIISKLQNVLIQFFNCENICPIMDCISEAVEKGENMMVLYKTKENKNLKASIFLQYLDTGLYLPHLFVHNSEGQELLHKKLKLSNELIEIGEIQLSSKKVTLKPKKNSFTANLSSIVFNF